MDSKNYTDYFSHCRLRRYLEAMDGDYQSACKLYDLQEQLSGVVHALLSRFEIVMRNQINKVMCQNFSPDWMLVLSNNQSVFATEATDSSYKMLQTARKSLQAVGKLTNDDMVAAVYFGYWTSILQRKQRQKLNNLPLTAFPSAPPLNNIAGIIHNNANYCRRIRNDVAHLEPLIFKNNSNKISLRKLELCTKLVLELSYWMDVNTLIYDQYINEIKRIEREIESLQRSLIKH